MKGSRLDGKSPIHDTAIFGPPTKVSIIPRHSMGITMANKSHHTMALLGLPFPYMRYGILNENPIWLACESVIYLFSFTKLMESISFFITLFFIAELFAKRGDESLDPDMHFFVYL